MNPQTNSQRLQQINQLLAQGQTSSPSATTQQQSQNPADDPANALQATLAGNQSLGNALQSYQQQQAQGINGATPQQQNALQTWAGMCEAWLEKQVYGKTGIFPSAIDAANHYAQTGQLKTDIQNAPPGAMVFLSPNTGNGGFGHAGQITKNGNFLSATYNGVQENNLQKWQQATGQKVLGYVIPH